MKRFLSGTAVLLAACTHSPTDSESQVRIDVDGSRFFVGESITATVQNASSEEVVFHHCGHNITLVLERREGTSWSDALQLNGPICPAVLPSGTLTLGPGEAQAQVFPAKMPGQFRIRAEFGKGVTRIAYLSHSSPFVIDTK